MSDPLRVLLVEDNPGDADLIEELLPGAGPLAFKIESPRLAAALERLRADRFDIVLLDLGLPDSAGLDTVRAMQQHVPGTPMVVLTGNDDERTGLAAIQAGAQDYVVKGQTSGALLSRVMRYAMERHQNAQRLRDGEAQLRRILEMTPLPICYIDKDGVIAFRNARFVQVFGYAADEAPTLTEWWLRAHPDARYRQWVTETLDTAVKRAAEDGRDIDPIEYEVTCKGGEKRSVVMFGITLGDDFLAVFTDFTERKRAEADHEKLEAQLRQAQKMEAVGQLAGGVAHDFNNMLTIILGYAGMALKTLGPSDPLHADIEQIEKAAQRSADLTRQLLAFARKQIIAPKVLDLDDSVAGMLKMLKRLIGEDIDLLWKPAGNLWPVNVDPAQIDQVLANLLVNARDAIAGVGKITIETGKLEVDSAYCRTHPGSVPGQYVILAVSDDGCGMDREIQERLFEPFFTTKELGKGTGLGLATVYGIVKQNGGFIYVYSEVGKGTTFRIYLPRHQSAETAADTRRAVAEAPTGTETVLLVEDESVVLALTQRLLEQLGYTVLAAASPNQAIQLAEQYAGTIHLLMTDLVLPQMNGRDLAERLVALRPSLKRLFMSGYTANAIGHRGVLDEGVCFLQKPFSRQALAMKVREALSA